MRRVIRLAVCCLMVMGTGLLSAARADEQQAKELRARADEILRDVQHLHEQGKHEAAQQLEREAVQLREKAEQVAREGRPESDRMHELAQHLRELSQQWLDATVDERQDAVERIEKEIHENERQAQERREPSGREGRQPNQEQMEVARQRFAEVEKRVEQLRREGQGEQADRLLERMANANRDMGMPHPQQDRPQPQGPQQGPQPQGQGPNDRGAMEQRMQHLRVAAKNLDQVGMQDLAEKLNREAEDIQRALLQGPQPADDPHRGAMEALQQECRKIHERLDEINRRLDELNNRLPRGR